MNLAVIHLMGFLVLLATVQLWNLLCQISGLQVIGRAHSKAWAEVQGFLLVILMLPTGYDIAVSTRFQCLSLPKFSAVGITLLPLEEVTLWKTVSGSWHWVLESNE